MDPGALCITNSMSSLMITWTHLSVYPGSDLIGSMSLRGAAWAKCTPMVVYS